MKVVLGIFAFLLSSYAVATEIDLAPGGSAQIRAGDTATVTCRGGGEGGRRDRCECIVGNASTDSAIPNCTNFGYVLKIRGAPVKSDGCWRSAVEAGTSCRSAVNNEFPECK